MQLENPGHPVACSRRQNTRIPADIQMTARLRAWALRSKK